MRLGHGLGCVTGAPGALLTVARRGSLGERGRQGRSRRHGLTIHLRGELVNEGRSGQRATEEVPSSRTAPRPALWFDVTQVRSSYHSSAAKVGSLRSMGLGNKKRGRTVTRAFDRQQAGYIRRAHDLISATVVLVVDEEPVLRLPFDPQRALTVVETGLGGWSSWSEGRSVKGLEDDLRVWVARIEHSGDIASDQPNDKGVVRSGSTAEVASTGTEGPKMTTYATPQFSGTAIKFPSGAWVSVEVGPVVVITWETDVTPQQMSKFLSGRFESVSWIDSEAEAGAGAALPSGVHSPLLLRFESNHSAPTACVVWEVLPDSDKHLSLVANTPAEAESLLEWLISRTSTLPVASAVEQVRRVFDDA